MSLGCLGAARRAVFRGACLVGLLAAQAACVEPAQDAALSEPEGSPAEQAQERSAQEAIDALPYARGVVSFEPGPGAGFGQDKLPGVVLGPPRGKGTMAGSLDVLSLGVGGQITLSFGAQGIVDGPGDDFIVFENPFWFRGDPLEVFAELAEVSVSEDGERWVSFPCDPGAAQLEQERLVWPGCAGYSPTLKYDPWQVVPLRPALVGGDGFDLAQVGLQRARFVRLRDRSDQGQAPSAGFDLDAVGIVHVGP